MWGLWFVGLLAPRPRQHRMLHPKGCSFEHKGFAGLQGVQFGYGGPRRPHAPRVNAGRLIPSCTLSGIKSAEMIFRKRRKDF